MKLLVGDIVFVLDKKSHAVVPCQLVEIVTTQTIDGETKKHVVTTPRATKKFNLEDHKSPWFSTYESSREYLLNAATQLIDQTLERALKVAEESFQFSLGSSIKTGLDESERRNQDISADSSMTIEENQEVYVEMAGQKVKVTLPKELTNV